MCVACPAGYYGLLPGLSSPSCSGQCRFGSYAVAGSQTCTVCPAGECGWVGGWLVAVSCSTGADNAGDCLCVCLRACVPVCTRMCMYGACTRTVGMYGAGTIGLSSGLTSVDACVNSRRTRALAFNNAHYILLNGSLATCSSLGVQQYAGSTLGRWNVSVLHTAVASTVGTASSQIPELTVSLFTSRLVPQISCAAADIGTDVQISVRGVNAHTLTAGASAFPLLDRRRAITINGTTVSLITSSSGGVSILALDLEMNVTQSRSSSGQYFLSVGLSSGLVDSGIALHGCSDRQPSGVVVTEVPACSHVRPDAVRAACKFDVAATGDDAYAASAAVAADVYASMYVHHAGSAGDTGDGDLSAGAVAGIVVGAVVGVAIIAGLYVALVMHRRASSAGVTKQRTDDEVLYGASC